MKTSKAEKRLPHAARSMYRLLIEQLGDSAAAQLKALDMVAEHYKPVGPIKNAVAKEAQPVARSEDSFIDVLVGGPEVSKVDGIYYAPEFWASTNRGVIKGDIEHIHASMAEGLYVDVDEKYHGFTPIAEKWWNDGGNLYARVYLPENDPYTPEFIKEWNDGKWGVSVEIPAPQEGGYEYRMVDGAVRPTITNAPIVGFSFVEDPKLSTKNNGKTE